MKREGKLASRLKIISLVTITFAVISLIGFACYIANRILDRAVNDQRFYLDPLSVNHYNEIKAYGFVPKTVLAGLGQGENNVFKGLPDDALFNDDIYKPDSLSWKQQDFLVVANSLYKHVRNDTLNDWQFYGLWFSKEECNDDAGFDYADISYFNPKNDEHTAIAIDLLNGTASLGVNQLFDSDSLFGGWKSLVPTNIKTTADEALRIAESHGGMTFRQDSRDSNCTIIVSLFADENVWEVRYDPNFQINVDPYSDHYETVMK